MIALVAHYDGKFVSGILRRFGVGQRAGRLIENFQDGQDIQDGDTGAELIAVFPDDQVVRARQGLVSLYREAKFDSFDWSNPV